LFTAMKNIHLVGDTVTIKSRYQESDAAALEALADAILSA